MNIVDSSCWLEYLMDTETGTDIASIIENPDELVVPTIILFEVYKKLLVEKGEGYASEVISYMQTGKIIELNASLSLSAAQISLKHKLPMADSIIYAVSLQHTAVIFTCDQHFKDIPDVHYFPKV